MNLLAETVFTALRRHPRFQRAALPLELSAPMINRYGQGMSYGPHFDCSFMPAPNGKKIRADMSATLFLSPSSEYDGGELCISRAGRDEEATKLEAGDLFLYPSCTMHSVRQVTRGERLAVVFWVQSIIRDHEQRSLVTNLDQVVGSLGRNMPESKEVRDLSAVVNSLTRMWGELGVAIAVTCTLAIAQVEAVHKTQQHCARIHSARRRPIRK